MRKRGRQAEPTPIRRSGTVVIAGRSNVGKSTLLNAALAAPLAIVSQRPQTTRDTLLGVVRHGDAEIGLLDTPGLHRARTRLGREMNRTVRGALRAADVVVLLVALPARGHEALAPHPADLRLAAALPADAPAVLALNKIDRLRDKSALLPLIAAYAGMQRFAAVVPISARAGDGVTRVLDEVAKLLPEGRARFDRDALTDRPLRYFAAEYVREPVLRVAREEVPHAVAVTVDELTEPVREGDVVRIGATIHVERAGQKKILIGRRGAALKAIGIAARERIEALMGQRVHLGLWVRVTEGWRDEPARLADFGLLARAAGARAYEDDR
jgi:GTP-binding protein Era